MNIINNKFRLLASWILLGVKRLLSSKICLILIAIIFGILIWAFSKVEVYRFYSPNRCFECVVKRYKYKNLIPKFPGQGSDYSCFLSIYKKQELCGTIPVAMASMINDLEWTENTASIRTIGEWNFSDETCFYWAENGNTKVFVK